MVSAIVIGSDKIVANEVGLTVRPDVTYEEWLAYGQSLSKAYSRIQWAVGDWINAGEMLFGEKYAQALDDTHFAYGTLRNYASICARIPQENRTSLLTFHQTKHVASLEPHEQRAIIEAAIQHNLPGDDILEAVQRVKGKKPQHDKLEGWISRSYSQDDGHYLVIRIESDVEWGVGQSVTLRVK